MTTDPGFHYEIEKTQDDIKGRITTVTCHGRLTSEKASKFKEAIKPIIADGGKIIVDFADVSYLDSSGLGALVGVKVSALHKGLCTLDLINISDRIKDLLRLANLTKLFSS
ncbi:hypothetical protein ACPOL_5928 [Acidisarcina polymorpha]|uniref:STAS domain-containing protein n=1 Tax=Acidisarcina polymorpha TaxID=2211140 RepID=A0A2Z5G7E6_9BACT|nr:STAS domain-containing protein [Acidisarcina polymorpha]AXC15172.1 hypothetical protein ACPOL_5928 [Acidisarcina polymorpha]